MNHQGAEDAKLPELDFKLDETARDVALEVNRVLGPGLLEQALSVELGLRAVRFARQVLSYLKAGDRSLGLLINFNVRLLRQA